MCKHDCWISIVNKLICRKIWLNKFVRHLAYWGWKFLSHKFYYFLKTFPNSKSNIKFWIWGEHGLKLLYSTNYCCSCCGINLESVEPRFTRGPQIPVKRFKLTPFRISTLSQHFKPPGHPIRLNNKFDQSNYFN